MRWIEREHFLDSFHQRDPTMWSAAAKRRIFLTFCSRFNFILSFRPSSHPHPIRRHLPHGSLGVSGDSLLYFLSCPNSCFRYRTACFGTILTISELPEAFYGVVGCEARHPKPPCDFRIRQTLTMQSNDGTFFLELIF
ncbi:hypothetical protein ANCCAN_02749 [Ancylostoma caninum]|uniref:Uncharacterized protein n=1 Tax=Ancylostoma caninum TaxID=29170 RepID=A0A368H775_ANCCA|nr:hypothetical protein ANCCAN_02749 [Ancylostoma caninum]